MGKVDDMRRLREAQHEQDRRARPAPAASVPPAAALADEAPVAATPRATAPSRQRSTAAADVGTCSSCGKLKKLQRGVIASHQKGLGTMCPGSRKPPA